MNNLRPATTPVSVHLRAAPLYALSTLVVEMVWRLDSRRAAHLFGAALLGGLAFMLKPLVLLVFAQGLSLKLGALRAAQADRS